MYKVTNLSRGQIVSTLKSGETLRLDYNVPTEVQDCDMTPYLKTIEGKGLIKIEVIAEVKSISEVTSKKTLSKKE